MKKTSLLLVLFTVAVMSLGYAYAEPSGATVLSETNLGQYGSTSDTTTVEAGNITLAHIETNASTYRWVGLLGNVTGSIVLGDNSNNILYQWSAVGNLVYASLSGSVTWSSLTNAGISDVTTSLPYLGTDAADNYTNTFTGAAEDIGSDIFSISADFAQTENTTGAFWKTYALYDTSNLVFAGKVQEDSEAYSGVSVDYQMIIPENGTNLNTDVDTYNLWIELQ